MLRNVGVWRCFARFFENESWHSAATTLRLYTQQHGLPRALYVDGHGIYRADWEPTPDEILVDIKPKTQFGRALHEFEVELIGAHSPQAKGRVERVNRTLQDRLVKELTRAGSGDLESANRYLVETYLPRFNRQCVVRPMKSSQGRKPNDNHPWRDRIVAPAAVVGLDNSTPVAALCSPIPRRTQEP